MLDLFTTFSLAATPGAQYKVWAYVAFIALVLGFLALDLGVFHHEAYEISI